MGGYGSTRWNHHIARCTVESCLTFDLKHIPMSEYMTADEPHMRSYNWTYTRDESSAGNMGGGIYHPERMELVFVYNDSRGDYAEDIKERIQVSTMPLHFGGVRTWLHCPACNRRVRTLHNPPGAIRFLCRDCHDLTYVSVQEAHKDDRGLFAGLGMLLTLDQKLEAIYKQLRKTRSYRGAPSKQRKRLQAKLDKLYQDFDKYTQMAQQTRFNTMASVEKLLYT